ncbi:MAG: hypothetical protein VX733_13500 [Candidatus Latescibacterota bacterium]|nr:hypothetical protein [Candidatus Latescibacterota bacterium]
MLLDTHLWVSTAAAGLALFAQQFLGLSLEAMPVLVVAAATMAIYHVDDRFDATLPSVVTGLPGWAQATSLALSMTVVFLCLIRAPAPAIALVGVGALPCLLYGAPLRRGRQRLRELPGIKPFFVVGALTAACVGVPVLWAEQRPNTLAIALATAIIGALTLCNVCFFDIRDRRADATLALRTIPLMVGTRATRRLCLGCSAGLLALIAAGAVPVHSVPPLAAAAGATACYALSLSADASRLRFALAVDGVPILLGTLVALR